MCIRRSSRSPTLSPSTKCMVVVSTSYLGQVSSFRLLCHIPNMRHESFAFKNLFSNEILSLFKHILHFAIKFANSAFSLFR